MHMEKIPKEKVRKSILIAYSITCIFLIILMLYINMSSWKRTLNTHIKVELDEVREWFCNNPPNGTNRLDRRKRTEVIQKACNELSASKYLDYLSSWTGANSIADTLEESYSALYYLRAATDHAIDDIRNTKVKKGLAVWYFYNMGYVFKIPEKCFAIDLHFHHAEKLADDLDFLLITHAHRDHYSEQLLEAMIKAEKPVITRWYPGSTIVKHPSEFMFDNVRVKVDIGDHHRHLPLLSTNNMLMFQIDFGEEADNCTIYHSGDGNNLKKMIPDKNVDIFIVHVQLPMTVEDAIKHLHPDITLVSHVLELSHSSKLPLPLRWSYDFAFKELKNVKETEAIVLTWGERWLLPNSLLEM